MQPAAPGREASGSTSDTFRLTAKESESFMHIVEATSKITRHYELFLMLQGEVQHFIPHQILISAWGNFRGSQPKLDVISAIQGVRTGQLNGCGIEQLLKGVFTRWVAGGRQPMLLENGAAEPITYSTCDCALHLAMRRMRSVLVHGIRNQRDDLDSLYMTLNPVSVKNGQSTERFFFLVDSLVSQIDVAFRKVAALKSSGGGPAGKDAPRISDNLSAREQEIVRWITEGKTNAEIAEILGISSFTVKNHAQRIFRKLNVTNRTEAVAKCRQENLPAP
jgi:transcriptional regulator EpsA